ncbi:MAG: hypothetical protein KJ046_14180, partial [Anaerolineae bacterium]|nr:hypothetical protein [Anaerolineae bacterium]
MAELSRLRGFLASGSLETDSTRRGRPVETCYNPARLLQDKSTNGLPAAVSSLAAGEDRLPIF